MNNRSSRLLTPGSFFTCGVLFLCLSVFISPAAAAAEKPDQPTNEAVDSLDEVEKISMPASRGEAELWLRRADDAYLDGRYEEASLYYSAVAEAGFDCADVWFNLGNANWRSDRPGPAVLAWERALLRNPGHEDASANLLVAEESLFDEVQGLVSLSFGERLARRLPERPLVWLFSGAWFLTVISLMVFRRAGRRKLIVAIIAALVLIFSIVSFSFLALVVWYREGLERAVVMAPAAQVRAGPAPRFEAQFEVHEGLVLRIVGYDGPYARIRLGNEREGWILRGAIEKIDLPAN